MDKEAETTTMNAQAAPGAAEEMALPAADAKDAEIEALKKELAGAKAKMAEYLDGWQRARADFSNYKKRQETETANVRSYATATLAAKLLPVVDDFERAAKTLPHALQGMTWIDGMLLIQRKLQLILESEGVKAIDVVPNSAFDPVLHEGISHDEAQGIASGNVIEEVQKGYKLGDRVIRPSLVRVAR